MGNGGQLTSMANWEPADNLHPRSGICLCSNKVRGFMEQGGWIRQRFEAGIALKAQYGEENVFDLSLGNPVVEPRKSSTGRFAAWPITLSRGCTGDNAQ